MKVFESELRGKTVMSAEGNFLGVLRGISANVQTGDLTNIHVEAADDIDTRLFHQDDSGRILFPFQNIRAVRDVVVVATN
ncbi:MAG: PRC-barrel domain-containing protein, partial [Thermoplasmatota archaeon]